MTTLVRADPARRQRTPRDIRRWVVDAVLVIAAVQFLIFGVWAFGWPHSFYLSIARFPPFSKHLVHDAGAFQVGIGATMLLALFWKHDALLTVLAGGSVAAVMHAISHVTDRHLGGRSSDPYTVGLLAVLLVIATVLRAWPRPNR